MFTNQKYEMWSDSYWNHVTRNIGPVKYIEQEQLRTTKIAVFGVGGLGGSLAEQLVRSGCQNLVIADFDVFDESNLNRQICTLEDMGKNKIDTVEDHLKSIDPEVDLIKTLEINPSNISPLLNDVRAVALSLDDPVTSILIARECRKRNIPMVESWGVPFLFTWWFTTESIDYESCYNLDTHHLSFDRMVVMKNKGEFKTYKTLLPHVFRIPGVEKTYNREPGAFEQMMSGEIGARSFAPFVRLTANYLAVDMIFAGILRIKPMVLAPNIVGFDYMKLKFFNISL
ncbi:MAG: ThiF family adenylyltransferase [Candidatus Hodarchaeota archaeon]